MALLQLRQHTVSYNSSSYAVVADTSLSISASQLGAEISVFAVFPRSWLHGKKVRFTRSVSGYSGSAYKQIVTEVVDGAYDRSSSVHFPSGARRISQGAGRLALIEAAYPDGSSKTVTSAVLDLSAGTTSFATLFWIIYSADWGYSWGVNVTSCEILDADDNVVSTMDIDAYAAGSTATGENYGLLGTIPAELQQVSSALVGIYGLYSDHLEVALKGSYHLLSAVSPVALVGIYSLVMEQAIVGRYGNATVVQAGLIGRYSDANHLMTALVGRYGDMVPVLAALEGRYHLMHDVVAGLVGQYAICGAKVLAGLVCRYDLKDRNEIMAALEGYYSLLPSATIQQISCPVRIGGVAVRWSSVSWSLSEDSYLIEATIILRDGGEFNSIAKMDTVEIDWAGTTYNLFVATKLRSRSISGDAGAAGYGAEYTIIARSLTAGLDAPYALPITRSWPSTTPASVIAADLIAPLADILTLDFRLEDWLQPGGTFFLTDESPLEGLRKLAAIVGGIVQTSPGNAIILRMVDAIPPPNWSTTAPAWTIEDSGLFSDSESEAESNAYNVITVTNQGESNRSTRFEVEVISDYRKRVRGYRVPWQDFGLTTSGGAWVTIEDGGVVEEQVVDELVEFIDGAASAAKPIYSQVSAVWLQASLGTITAAEDGSLTSAVAGNSLAKITYTTRCHVWIGASDRSEEVQFYEVDL